MIHRRRRVHAPSFRVAAGAVVVCGLQPGYGAALDIDYGQGDRQWQSSPGVGEEIARKEGKLLAARGRLRGWCIVCMHLRHKVCSSGVIASSILAHPGSVKCGIRHIVGRKGVRAPVPRSVPAQPWRGGKPDACHQWDVFNGGGPCTNNRPSAHMHLVAAHPHIRIQDPWVMGLGTCWSLRSPTQRSTHPTTKPTSTVRSQPGTHSPEAAELKLLALESLQKSVGCP